jgi:hypothetical protein
VEVVEGSARARLAATDRAEHLVETAVAVGCAVELVEEAVQRGGDRLDHDRVAGRLAVVGDARADGVDDRGGQLGHLATQAPGVGGDEVGRGAVRGQRHGADPCDPGPIVGSPFR